jgi:outer membrane protein assembly factor BamE (lipoprotein component of BamABCDE complex)
MAIFLLLPTLLTGTSCSADAPEPAVLNADKVASVVIGRSSRADVFSALGRPSRTERSALGEAWIYEAKARDTGGQGLISGVSTASGVAGAFVPYAGLVGSGLGLAGAAMGKAQPIPVVVSLAVAFAQDGVVRDCVYSSTAFPVGVPDPATGAVMTVDCGRPAPSAERTP